MNRKVNVVIILFLFIIGVASCDLKKNSLDGERFAECQSGFIEALGNHFIETPKGYYALAGNYLIYMDQNMENDTLLCNKPECLHNRGDMEEVVNCNAFFGNCSAIQYYDGKLYILANALNHENERAIYEVSLDGSDKKKIYTGGENMQSFIIYRDDILVYEKKYMPEEKNPITQITRFPVIHPDKGEVIFENKDYGRAEINELKSQGNQCYFELFEFSEDKGIICHGKRIDLTTNKVYDFCSFANIAFLIGSDRVLVINTLETDNENWTWTNEYYECSLEGEKKQVVTEKDYSALGWGGVPQAMDDKYVYISDISYGANAVPEEERYYYIYTYDGKLVGKILRGIYSGGGSLYPGSEDFLIIRELIKNGEEQTIVYYKVDKSEFGKKEILEPEEFLRVHYSEFMNGYSY